MSTLYNQELKEVSEYKKATENQKSEKDALRVVIATILSSLTIGSMTMIIDDLVDDKKPLDEQGENLSPEDNYVTLDELPGVELMPEPVELDEKNVKDSLYLQFNSSFLEPEWKQEVVVLKSNDNNAYKLTMLYDQNIDGWKNLGFLDDEISEELIKFYHLSRVNDHQELHIYAVCEPENKHLTQTHTALICTEETSKDTNLYKGYVLNDLGLFSDFVENKREVDKKMSDINLGISKEGVGFGK